MSATFEPRMQAGREGPREKEWRHGVHFELRANLVGSDLFEGVGNEQSCVVNQEVNLVVCEPFGELGPRQRVGQVDRTFDAHPERVKPRRVLATDRNHARSAGLELSRELKADSTIGTCDD